MNDIATMKIQHDKLMEEWLEIERHLGEACDLEREDFIKGLDRQLEIEKMLNE